jgi:hypothetical protein
MTCSAVDANAQSLMVHSAPPTMPIMEPAFAKKQNITWWKATYWDGTVQILPGAAHLACQGNYLGGSRKHYTYYPPVPPVVDLAISDANMLLSSPIV